MPISFPSRISRPGIITASLAACLLGSALTTEVLAFGALGQSAQRAVLGKALPATNQKDYGNTVLLPEELKECLKDHFQQEQQRKELMVLQQRINAQKQEIANFNQQLSSKRSSTDFSDPIAVHNYNLLSEKKNVIVNSVNQMVIEYNEKQSALNQAYSEFDLRCSNKDYYPDDYQKAIQELNMSEEEGFN